jgi:hypothetical protein
LSKFYKVQLEKNKYCVHMYENGKMRLVEAISGLGEKGEEGE